MDRNYNFIAKIIIKLAIILNKLALKGQRMCETLTNTANSVEICRKS